MEDVRSKAPMAALVDDAMRHMDRMVFDRARQSQDANELTGYLNEFPKVAVVEATLKKIHWSGSSASRFKLDRCAPS